LTVETGGDENGLSFSYGHPFRYRTAGQTVVFGRIKMDLRTKKQKAIDNASALIANRVWHVLQGDGKTIVSAEAIKVLLEREFRDVHEIQEDDGR